MSTSTFVNPPLGSVLLQAGLVSGQQIKLALDEQRRNGQCQKLGTILAAHGWLKQASADFFAEEWPLLQHQAQQRLGQYLKRAALLETAQVDAILDRQQQTQQRFGTLAILNGWVRRRTVNFFLQHLDSAGSASLLSEAELLQERLLENERVNPFSLLLLYQRLLQQGSVNASDRPEQSELVEMGIATVKQGKLQLADEFDASLFDQQWVTQQLETLRPYDWIRLKLFKLAKYSDYPYRALAAILSWTSGHIDLTHKLGWAIREADVFIAAGEEETQVAALAQAHMIHNWESGVAAKHLQRICDRISNHPLLLKLYQRVLEQEGNVAEDSPEEQELLTLGLITNSSGTLSVANRIYQHVFNPQWVAQQRLVSGQLASDEALSTEKNTSLPPTVQLESEAPSRTALYQELSAANVVSNLAAEAQLPITTALPSRGIAAPRQTPAFEKETPSSPSPPASAARSRTWVGLGLCTAAGLLAAIGAQIWRQQTQVSPIVTAPSFQQDSIKASPPSLSQINALQRFAQRQDSAAAADQSMGETGDRRDQSPRELSIPTVVSASNPAIKVPIFVLGSTLEQVTETLGPPTWNRRGFYGNSRALLYKGIVPNQVDLGYLVSKRTGKLRQTETTFAKAVPLETIQKTLSQLLQGTVPASVQKRLTQIYERQANQHTFQVRGFEGDMHWQPQDGGWIYIGIWDADFH